MGCRKTVTELKLAANRRNAQRSTGPRTERGKNTSKFNAVITGLFAKHVVIPLCDGEGSEEQFAQLLADLKQEFRPEGPLEELYVEKLAKSMWRFRRATCAEKGSVRRGKLPDIYVRLKTKPITDAIGIVQSAQMEIKTTGTLSPAAYAAVLAEIRRIQACGPQSEEGIILTELKIDDQFLVLLERCRGAARNGARRGTPYARRGTREFLPYACSSFRLCRKRYSPVRGSSREKV
jgi:hypothetical protein